MKFRTPKGRRVCGLERAQMLRDKYGSNQILQINDSHDDFWQIVNENCSVMGDEAYTHAKRKLGLPEDLTLNDLKFVPFLVNGRFGGLGKGEKRTIREGVARLGCARTDSLHTRDNAYSGDYSVESFETINCLKMEDEYACAH